MARSPNESLRPETHARIALIAHARGFISLATFAEAMAAANRGELSGGRDVWLEKGRLTPDQLDAVLAELRAESLASQPAPGEPIVRENESVIPPLDPLASRHTGGVGTLVAHRYVIERSLGDGGMGELSVCFDTLFGRRVAMKRLTPKLRGDKFAAAMLEREARVTESLDHPNIIPIYDSGRDKDGIPYYVMRLLPEQSLEDVLRRLRDREPDAEGRFTQSHLLHIFVQICDAVAYAHERQTVHGDLKPGNVLVGEQDEVVVVDWGLAHVLGEAGPLQGGTPGYMAPEQGGLAVPAVDLRTDVFSLGAMLYELLSHHCPFPDAVGRAMAVEMGSPPTAYSAMVTPPPPSAVAPMKSISHALDAICLRALSLDPNSRFPSARELREAIVGLAPAVR